MNSIIRFYFRRGKFFVPLHCMCWALFVQHLDHSPVPFSRMISKYCVYSVLRLPFDRKTFPIGYSISSCFELVFLLLCSNNASLYIEFLSIKSNKGVHRMYKAHNYSFHFSRRIAFNGGGLCRGHSIRFGITE